MILECCCLPTQALNGLLADNRPLLVQLGEQLVLYFNSLKAHLGTKSHHKLAHDVQALNDNIQILITSRQNLNTQGNLS